LAAELQAATGRDVGLQRDGIAAVAFDPPRAAALRDLARRHRAAGLRAEWLEPADVARRWHGAAPGCAGALFAPDDAAIAPPALTAALLAHAIQWGTRLIGARVERVSHRAGRIEGVVTGPRVVAARHVVLAAGAWSPGIAGLPRALPVVPVRGQIALAPWPAGMPAAILYHDHGYVLRRGDSALVGSTMEHAGFDARITSEGQAAILAGARRLLPSLNGVISGAWAGLRPVTPDGLPLVGPDPEIDGLWYATGHGRNGILLAALTGDVMADLITTGGTDVDISLFRPERFMRASAHLGPRP
jgi:glycine oxidase